MQIVESNELSSHLHGIVLPTESGGQQIAKLRLLPHAVVEDLDLFADIALSLLPRREAAVIHQFGSSGNPRKLPSLRCPSNFPCGSLKSACRTDAGASVRHGHNIDCRNPSHRLSLSPTRSTSYRSDNYSDAGGRCV